MGDYRALKLACMSRGQLYEDQDFPPLASSLYHSKRVSSDIRWARPKTVCDNAEFVSSIGSTLDLHPGLADNPGFSCAASLIALKPALFKKVVLPGQDFGARYVGIFHFNIWHCGEWREVVIDDRVPIRDNQPAFCRNRKQPSEFWCALLEKAYAKVHGSYEALESLQAQDVLVDLTGGVADFIDMPSRPPKGLFQVMAIFHTMNTIMACTIPSGGSKHGGEQKKGLSRGATYLVSDVVEKSQPGKKNKDRFIFIRDTRQRNSDSIQQLPWIIDGYHGSTNNKNELCLPYRTWKKHFGQLVLCHLSFEGQMGEGAKRRWYVSSECGLWERGRSAGGCGNPPDEELYWTNPQFVMQLKPGSCSGREQMIMVSVLQKPAGWGAEGPPSRSAISIDIYKLLETTKDRKEESPFDKSVLELVRGTETYCDLREVTLRTTLPVGHYVIIPSTYLRDECSEFLLRTVTETRAHLRCVHGSPTPNRSSLASPHLSELSSLEIIYGIGRQDNYNRIMSDAGMSASPTNPVGGLSVENSHFSAWRQGPISPPETDLTWAAPAQRQTQASPKTLNKKDDRTIFEIQESFFPRTLPKQRSKPLKRRNIIEDVTVMLSPCVSESVTSDSEASAPPSPPTRLRVNNTLDRSDHRVPFLPLTVDVQEPLTSTRLTVHDIHHTLSAAGMLGSDGSTNLETCRNLMAMADPQGRGTIDSQTIAVGLWDQISTWQEAFVCMTSDVHRDLHREDLADALQLVDVDIGAGGLAALVRRYSGKDGCIKYVDFLSCVARCKAAWDMFQCHRIGESRSSCLTIEQWMESFLR